MARGGAKAGIVTDEKLDRSQKEILIKRFGELISDNLKGRKYISGSDIGTDMKLINELYRSAGVNITKRSTGSPNSGYFTALSVLVAIEECLRLKRLDFQKCAFAIQGFGSVGSSLALEIYKKGGRVVAISDKNGAIYKKEGLDIPEILKQKSFLDFKDAECIPRDQLLGLSVDVLSPCALGSAINKNNMDKIQAKIICAGANEAVTIKADHHLFKKGILYLPDFATNCGGLLGNAMEFMSLDKEKILDFFRETLAPKYRKLYEISQATKITPREIAIEIAEESFKQMKFDSENKKIKTKIFNIALKSYHHGLIPKFIVRGYAHGYFKKLIVRDSQIYNNFIKL
jgi:glutamate dehydrogenase/leucine dehydrogenase